MPVTNVPQYFEITEWDDSTDVVLAVLDHSDVLMKYGDGVTHKVTRRYFEDGVKARIKPVCACGCPEPLTDPGWGQWPCCPWCGQN